MFYLWTGSSSQACCSKEDDTIIFSNGNKASLQLILKTLESYENVSGQLINKNKSSYSLAPKAPQRTIRRIGRILDMEFENLPLKYLGFPIYFGRKTQDIFLI
uniref:Putative ovule protein n=1 Tax=Solanum chacoense TaxID=4108 RepID=A0A0V0H0B7_SOLCH